MKRHIIFLLIAFLGISAMAQNAQQESVVTGKPIKMLGSMVYMDGKKLNKENAAACFNSLDGVDRSADYLKYRAGYKTGLGLTIGGTSLAAVGFGSMFFGVLVALPHAFAGEEHLASEIAIYAGYGAMVMGGACVVAGIQMICVYKTRLNRLKKAYNLSLEVGTTSNGLSMAISF
jgi:hypothetical protein